LNGKVTSKRKDRRKSIEEERTSEEDHDEEYERRGRNEAAMVERIDIHTNRWMELEVGFNTSKIV
jgi:hypothetical protein